MKHLVRVVFACAGAALLLAAEARASALVYTNAPCVYLLVSNGTAQSAVLLGPTGSFAGALTVPVYVRSSLFNVTAVAPGAFRDCAGLGSFALDPASKVGAIGAGAFWGCTNLASVTLQASVTQVGPSAFLGCSALTNVNLAAATGLADVAQQTFGGCSRLPALTMPGGVTNVGLGAFRGCSALTNIVVPSGVAVLPEAAFQGCRRLASASFTGVAVLGVNAFAETGLTNVAIPAAMTDVAQGAFSTCTNLVSVTCASAALAELSCAAFRDCSALTDLPLAAALTNLASSTFAGCSRARRAALPAGVTSVPDNLFAGCTSLVAVAAEASVASLGSCSFAECPALTNVTFKGNAPRADDTSFEESTNAFVDYYRGATGWGNLLARRPTVMLGADGSVASLSFAAWAVRRGLASSSSAGLSAATLEAVFAAESSTRAGLVNGAVYAFGDNLTAADQASLIELTFDDAGTPIVVIPALDDDNATFVDVSVLGTGDLSSAGGWTLSMLPVALSDATRAGYTPVGADGYTPASACFRLRLSLRE